jgi:hypothetical protein
MTTSKKPWPPLIIASEAPRWVRWRDFVLTLLMWLLLAVMLETEFELVVQHNLVRFGLGEYRTDPNWPEFFERLAPFLAASAILIAMLVVSGLFTRRRRRHALSLPLPPPLDLAAQARRAGLSEPELAAARELSIAVVHIGPDGRHRVEARVPAREA